MKTLLSFLLTLHLGAVAPAHARIEGTGSSWSANAVNQWIADVDSQGLEVVFTSTGSAQGRKDFGFGSVDYAVTDIPFQGRDSQTEEQDTAQGRPYVYLPIVAGGTSFPYHVKVAGQLVRDLRLSGETLAKIFTGKITNWNDPQITSDNNGRVLPSLTIHPVLHSEGSGSSAQFTAYLAKQYPALWRAHYPRATMTEYFPTFPNAVAQNGSDQVMNYIASASGNGTIGYDEYSYALNKNFPVAKLENANHYFTLPTQYNVAKSLTAAEIDRNPSSPTYLMQKLDNVYGQHDNRTYPLSSYSYLILPVGTSAQDRRMTTPKRQTLVDFLYYSICSGQREMGPIGYSPLPVNLVQAGFEQLRKLKDVDPAVDFTSRDVGSCNNPTFVAGDLNRNYLAEIAPNPPDCDQRGKGPCGASASRPQGNTPSGTNPSASPGSSTGPGADGGTVIDPDTGQVIGNQPDDSALVEAAAGSSGKRRTVAYVLLGVSGVELVALLLVPAAVVLVLGLRRRRDS